MTDLQYSLIRNSGGEVITVFYDGKMLSATDAHPNWAEIKAGVEADDVNVMSLFDPGMVAQSRFERLSDRVTVKSGKVFWDNQPVHNALTEQVIRFLKDGQEDFTPLVNFFEKVQTNENEHSREQLFDWLNAHDFTILPNGNFIGYKGVRKNGDSFESISHGTAISNGIEYNGAIPNPLGAIVEMPRDQVQHDPSVGCHTGLHVGTWSYASGFARGAVLKVEVNPRDVVSVPTDCGHQKLRTCRYTVLEVIDAPVAGPLDYDYAEDDYDSDDNPYGIYDEDEDDYGFDLPVEAEKSVVQTMAGPVDTRFNHLRQKRDKYGRFIPKSK
ncbi:RIIB lysis inhibitor [Streptomyces phage Bmoc]|uniref:RIIB-like protein n=1 Tax=Streptomyces phage Bmoc TaxID=2725629 RepID=A0A6M3T0W9_9CAUD|nr:RIIB lysis inhibitor [Streptomyces phage Bmoc]QJD50932.1 rIIB-like protein [Streptomyces phage Bmoc]